MFVAVVAESGFALVIVAVIVAGVAEPGVGAVPVEPSEGIHC